MPGIANCDNEQEAGTIITHHVHTKYSAKLYPVVLISHFNSSSRTGWAGVLELYVGIYSLLSNLQAHYRSGGDYSGITSGR